MRVTEVDAVELTIELRQLPLRCVPPRAPWLAAMIARDPLPSESDAAWLRMRPAFRRSKLRVLGGVVRARVPGQRVLIGDDRPPVLGRQLLLPRRHGGSGSAEGLHEAALADPPEPVGIGHRRDHLAIAERRRLQSQAASRRTVTPTPLAVDRKSTR